MQTAEEIVPNYFKDNKLDAAGLAGKLRQFFEV